MERRGGAPERRRKAGSLTGCPVSWEQRRRSQEQRRRSQTDMETGGQEFVLSSHLERRLLRSPQHLNLQDKKNNNNQTNN